MRVVVCITSYNRVDCARILAEIIKLNWQGRWPIVHATAAAEYAHALEDLIIYRDPKPLAQGALDLLQVSIEAAITHYSADYVIHLEADTWILDQQVVLRYLTQLSSHPSALIAASSWSADRLPEWQASRNPARRARALMASMLRRVGIPYGLVDQASLATQFFVAKCTPEMRDMFASMRVEGQDWLERLFYAEVTERFGQEAIIGMPEREPVHPHFRNACDGLRLISHHWPSVADAPPGAFGTAEQVIGKKEGLAAAALATHGPNMTRLLSSDDLSYYNGNAPRR
jgi:hypothetical protein